LAREEVNKNDGAARRSQGPPSPSERVVPILPGNQPKNRQIIPKHHPFIRRFSFQVR
jgi:hypothetical protein